MSVFGQRSVRIWIYRSSQPKRRIFGLSVSIPVGNDSWTVFPSFGVSSGDASLRRLTHSLLINSGWDFIFMPEFASANVRGHVKARSH
jgi:hypothetical protein